MVVDAVGEGEDGGGLTISRDGTAIYYCEEEQFSEPDDRWSWEAGTIHIVLEKLHCTITAVPEGEGTDTLLFVSGSRNWSAERFRKLPAENELYRKSAMRSYDDNITILPDGFFMHCMIMIVVLVAAGAAVCFIAAAVQKRKKM